MKSNKSNNGVNKSVKPLRQLQVVKDAAESSRTTLAKFGSGRQISDTLQNLKDSINIASYIEPPLSIPTPDFSKPQWQIEKELNEAEIAKIQLQALKKQQMQTEKSPEYDQNTGIITFLGKEIQIPLDTNLEMVCRAVLKNIKSMRKKWIWEDILEANKENPEDFTWNTIHTAADSVNKKVASKTTIEDFFLLKPITTVQLNPKFVR